MVKLNEKEWLDFIQEEASAHSSAQYLFWGLAGILLAISFSLLIAFGMSFIIYITMFIAIFFSILPFVLYGYKQYMLNELMHDILKDQVEGYTEDERCYEIYRQYLDITSSLTGLNLWKRFCKMINKIKRPIKSKLNDF